MPAGDRTEPGPRLEELGWRGAEPVLGADEEVARVARVDRGVVTVLGPSGSRRVRPVPALGRARDPRQRPAVGDWAVVEGELVTRLLERTSEFVRGSSDRGRDAGTARRAQVVAANLDTVMIVHSLPFTASPRRIERELVLVHEARAEPVVLLTKADLVDDVEAAVAELRTRFPEVDIHAVSTRRPGGADVLHRYTSGHRTVAFIGPSGVGKSSLVNELVGGDVQAVATVRETDRKGRHTTVARELVPLPDGGILIDTPGLRAVALWDADDGFGEAFADLDQLAAACRFSNCTHESEPGCAVRAAIERGELDESRLANYRMLDAELDRVWEQQRSRERGRRRR